MRREGTPAWMQVVERRLEQAAEEARSRPAKAGIQKGEVGMLDGLCFLPVCWLIPLLSFPLERERPSLKP